MCSLVRNFSSKSSLRSLAEETQEVSLICFIAEAFVHKSNSSAFFFVFHLHPTECPTNNFSSSHVKFQFIFAHFHSLGLGVYGQVIENFYYGTHCIA